MSLQEQVNMKDIREETLKQKKSSVRKEPKISDTEYMKRLQ